MVCPKKKTFSVFPPPRIISRLGATRFYAPSVGLFMATNKTNPVYSRLDRPHPALLCPKLPGFPLVVTKTTPLNTAAHLEIIFRPPAQHLIQTGNPVASARFLSWPDPESAYHDGLRIVRHRSKLSPHGATIFHVGPVHRADSRFSLIPLVLDRAPEPRFPLNPLALDSCLLWVPFEAIHPQRLLVKWPGTSEQHCLPARFARPIPAPGFAWPMPLIPAIRPPCPQPPPLFIPIPLVSNYSQDNPRRRPVKPVAQAGNSITGRGLHALPARATAGLAFFCHIVPNIL